jgi:hypothetical protein
MPYPGLTRVLGVLVVSAHTKTVSKMANSFLYMEALDYITLSFFRLNDMRTSIGRAFALAHL